LTTWNLEWGKLAVVTWRTTTEHSNRRVSD